jgi:hypothetical protein
MAQEDRAPRHASFLRQHWAIPLVTTPGGGGVKDEE